MNRLWTLALGIAAALGAAASVPAARMSDAAPAVSADALRRALQDAALRLLRYEPVDRAGIVAAYWSGYGEVAEPATPAAIEREFGDRLWRLDAPPLVKLSAEPARLTLAHAPTSWSAVEGRALEVPLVVRNQSGTPLDLAVEATGGLRRRLSVPAGGARASFVAIPAPLPRRIRFQFRSGAEVLDLEVPIAARRTGRLSVRLEDAAGRPAAARCYLSGADGMHHAPPGAIPRITRVSGEPYFHAAGEFTVELPEGEARLEAVRGFEFEPERRTVAIEAGRTTRVRITLVRRIDPAAFGWYSGDVHVHANLVDNEFVQPRDVALAAHAEALDLVNLLVSNSGGRFDNPVNAQPGSVVHDRRWFTGAPDALSDRDLVLVWNQEVRSRRLYGHLTLLGLRRLIEPPGTGWPGTAYADDYPANFTLAREARTQGALVSYSHPAYISGYQPFGAAARELPVDAALGLMDAFELFCTHEAASLELYYRLLDCGFALPVSAGTDAFLNYGYATTLGAERVYVHTGGTFGYGSWMEGLRAGRSSGSNGAFLLFELGGKLPGARIARAPGGPALAASVRLQSLVPVSRVEIVANGEVVSRISAPERGETLQWSGTLPFDRSAWVAARAWGPPHRLVLNVPSPVFGAAGPREVLLAHTSPVYVDVAGRRPGTPAAAAFFEGWVARLIGEVRDTGVFRDEGRRREVLAEFEEARRIYARLAAGAR